MLSLADLRALIDAGEQFDVEFLGGGTGRESPSDREIVEAVICLANGRGGVVLIGVDDGGELAGASHRHGGYTDPRRIEALISSQTVPACPVECSVVAADGVELLVIEVPIGLPVTSTSDGLYVRRGTDSLGRPKCLPYLAHEMQSREASRGMVDYSALLLPEARWEDLDPLELERLRQTVARNAGRADARLLSLSDADLVKALGLGEGWGERVDRLRVAGLLMLGREEALRRFVPNHEVAFQVLRGTRIVANDFFRWPLIRVAEELGSRFDARNDEEEMAVGPIRVGVPRFSPLGFREAVHNALVHRDYTRIGAVHVQLRDTDAELEISNPGGFPEGVRIDSLLVTPPRPRNPVLAEAFKRVGLVERTGRGIDTIYEGQIRFGRELPDYSRSSGASVCVLLAGGLANLQLARVILSADQPSRRLSLEEMLVIAAIDRDGEIGLGRAATLLQRHEGSARAVLDRLVEADVLEAREDRRGPLYRLSGLATIHTGGPIASKGQREERVLEFIEANGRITRAQAMELCGVEGREARSILERLVKRGDLVVRGERRGSYYERARVMNVGSKL